MTRVPFPKILTVLTVLSSVAVDAPAADLLITDRPDFNESSSTVGSGVLQLESGITFAEFHDGTEVTTIGEILARWGVAKKLELRFVLPTYSSVHQDSVADWGFLDSGVGLKYELAQGDGNGFIGGMELAVIASTMMPTGTSSFSSEKWQPAAVIAASWELGPMVGIGTNLGMVYPADEDDRFTSLWASVALGVGLTEAASMFVELYGFNREEERGPNTATFQIGFVYLLSPDQQLDARAARRLTDHGVDPLVGAGVSWRLRR